MTENETMHPGICNNGIDDDCNSLIDCDDPNCWNDPYCTGNATLHGYTFDDQKYPIDMATVTGYPPFKPIVATFTDINGFYNYTIPSGAYTFKATKFGYDPNIILQKSEQYQSCTRLISPSSSQT